MVTPSVETRINELEELFAAFLRAQEQTQLQINELARESRESKREMGGFKDEMRAFKDEMRAFKDEMRAFKRESSKQWGELADSLGKMAEDLVAPGVPQILRRVTGCNAEREQWCAVRFRRHPPGKPGEVREFDVVAVCDDWAVIVEVRSRLRPEDIVDFSMLMGAVRPYFPELASKKLIGAVGTLYPNPSVVVQGSRAGLVVLGLGDHLLEACNADGFEPRVF